MKKITFLVPYPFDIAPGQRFRYEQYLTLLKENGYTVLILPFLSNESFKILYKDGYMLRKILGILQGFTRRIVHVFKLLPSKYVFIYREASPIGFPVFEWIIAKLLRKRIIYDFDDAIWLPSTSVENRIIESLKHHQKVKRICKWAYKVSVGNNYLKEFALQFNKNTILNPTTIDNEHYHNQIKNQDSTTIVIGWTGTHSTLKYLDLILPVLQRLEEKYHFSFEVIADKEIRLPLKNFKFKKWKKETEIEDLLNFNIGLMPLYDDTWSKGKCGFKSLQYMALGITPVVSPVGVNLDIITEGVDGFCCVSEDEWYSKLAILIEQSNLRKTMGHEGIKKVSKNYSLTSNKENFLSLFS